MKKIIVLVLSLNILINPNMVSGDAHGTNVTASGSAQAGNLQTQTEQPVTAQQTSEQHTIIGDATTFISEHKREVVLLAVAITLGLSLKYCPWVQGLVGIDTEAEIDDWRVFIQK